eukprot:7483644-Lingulodinium_polyedra.AAC.1
MKSVSFSSGAASTRRSARQAAQRPCPAATPRGPPTGQRGNGVCRLATSATRPGGASEWRDSCLAKRRPPAQVELAPKL